MAIGEVAGSTVSTAFASTQANNAQTSSTQRAAQEELKANSQATPEGASNTEPAQSVTAAASSSESNGGATNNSPRGTRLDITV